MGSAAQRYNQASPRDRENTASPGRLNGGAEAYGLIGGIVFDNTVLEVVIGLIFVFFVLSLLVSGINEVVRKILNTRSKSLWTAIQRMLDEGAYDYPTDWSPAMGDAPQRVDSAGVVPQGQQAEAGGPTLFDQFFNHPLISRLDPTPSGKASRLSHIPATDFARAMVDILARDGDAGEPAWDRMGDNIQGLPAPLRSQLEVLWAEANENIHDFRVGLESWFDASMQRVSNWYKKRSRLAMFGYGLLVAVVLNVSAIIVTVDLYENDVIRDTVIGLAEQRVTLDVEGQPTGAATGCTDRECFREEVRAIADTGLPVFWRRCPPGSGAVCGFEDSGRVAATIAGWLVTAAALSMGASFWFALLKRAFELRSGTVGRTA